MCANVIEKFLNSDKKISKDTIRDTEIGLGKGEIKIIAQFDFNKEDFEKGLEDRKKEVEKVLKVLSKEEAEKLDADLKTDYRRMYGRMRIQCDDYSHVCARVLLLSTNEIEILKSNLWSILYEQPSGTRQFTGVVDYTQINVQVNNMAKNEYFVLTDRSDKYNPELDEETSETKPIFKPDGKESPVPKYVKPKAYQYFFGNFGIVYNVRLNYTIPKSAAGYDKGNKISTYPFGHNYAQHSTILIKTKTNGKWKILGPIGPCNYANEDNWTSTPYFSFNLEEDEFYFVLSGGNCGLYKFVLS